MTYTKQDVELLDKIVNDIDLQLKEFNEILPYEYNKNAYSPRLINLLLTTCVIIEKYCKLMQVECNLPAPTRENGGIRQLLKNIDQNGVLRNMEWTTAFNDNFQPFDGNYDWWALYNDTKHDTSFNITDVKYHHVVTAIVALHSLQRLVHAKLTNNWTTLHGKDLLDITKWDKRSNLSWQTHHELFHTYTAPKNLRS
jgi:hypothetical protein